MDSRAARFPASRSVLTGAVSRRTLGSAVLALGCAVLVLRGSSDVHAQTGGQIYYVAPDGLATNDGSIGSPLSLAAAIGPTSPARPGDTIYLRGGTYVGNFGSDLKGTPQSPIVVRQYPGERATLDANAPPLYGTALAVRGHDTWFWGFEVTDSHPDRLAWRPILVDVTGPRIKLINLIVHDGGGGFGAWSTAPDAELYGSLIYNVGWDDAVTRGHGHSIYVQNESGTKLIEDNILYNGFSFGIHAYTEQGAINNLQFRGNIAFNAGRLSVVSGVKSNLLLGGNQVANDAVIDANVLYYSPGLYGRNMDIGYVKPCNRPLIQNNDAGGANAAISINCSNALVTGNSFYGSVPDTTPSAYPNNIYHATRPPTHTVVRPNRYENGRGHVAVFNWDLQPFVSVDLSGIGLSPGDRFEVRDAQNYFAGPVHGGVYDGTAVLIPMTGLTAVAPIGNAPIVPPHTGPEFGAFIVQRVGFTATSPPVANLTVSPATILAGETTTLNWLTANAETVSIDQGIGPVTTSGALTVSPVQTTTYTLSATNPASTVLRSVTVNVNVPPAVSVGAVPSAAAAPATIALAAVATDGNGTVSQVSFYNGTTLLGIDTIAPYEYLWDGVMGGTYVVTARATDNQGASTTSAPVTVVVTAPGGGTSSATFLRTDATTQGSWKGTYGSQAYILAQDGTVLPDFAQVATSQVTSKVWSASGTQPRFLERANGQGRFSAVWESQTAFLIDVVITDGRSHDAAFYLMDWGTARKQTIEALDPVTGQVLDQRTAASFRDGQYWIWRVAGHVRFRITRVTGDTAAVSAVFIDPVVPAAPNTPPVVNLSASPANPSAPATLTLSASATDNGTVSQVSFYWGSTLVGLDTSEPFNYVWPNVSAGTYVLTARATDNLGAVGESAPITVTVAQPAQPGPPTPPGPPAGGAASALFIGVDTARQGNWRGFYGAEGYSLARDATTLPAFAQVAASQATASLWSGSGTQARFLQRPTGTERFSGVWEHSTTFSINVTLSDGLSHRVALYLMDWGTARKQTIEVLDTASGIVLDQRPAASFRDGQYWTWQISGAVRFRITRTAGDTAAVSAVFVDPLEPAAPNTPPAVSMSVSPANPSAPATLTLSASATDNGTVSQVSFYQGATLLGSDTSEPFSYVWPNVSAGTYVLTARATDNLGAVGESAPITVTVAPPAPPGPPTPPGPGGGVASAAFIGVDAVSQGNWRGFYGAEGYSLARDATTLPAFAQVATSQATASLWSSSGTQARFLQRPTGTNRFSGVWEHPTTFLIDVTLSDDRSHRVSLYLMDWGTARKQTIEVFDAASGIVLDQRTAASFRDGQYWTWQISGAVRFRITRVTGDTAAVSAVFIDP